MSKSSVIIFSIPILQGRVTTYFRWDGSLFYRIYVENFQGGLLVK